jgi:hypothetical protein
MRLAASLRKFRILAGELRAFVRSIEGYLPQVQATEKDAAAEINVTL